MPYLPLFSVPTHIPAHQSTWQAIPSIILDDTRLPPAARREKEGPCLRAETTATAYIK